LALGHGMFPSGEMPAYALHPCDEIVNYVKIISKT